MPPTRRRNPPSQITVMDLRPPPHRSGGKVRSATGMIGCVGPIPARVRLLPGSWSRRGSRTGIGRYGSGRVSRPGCVRGQIPAAMTPGSSARVSTAGYWLSDGPQRPAFCLVSTAFRGSVLIIPGSWVRAPPAPQTAPQTALTCRHAAINVHNSPAQRDGVAPAAKMNITIAGEWAQQHPRRGFPAPGLFPLARR
jgi:hypothetical protein